MHCQRQQRGFSLIELMVVVVIIGLAAAAIRLTFSPSSLKDGSDELLKQFQRQLVAAQQHAVTHNVDLALRPILKQPERFEFAQLNPDTLQWELMPETRWSKAEWPDDVRLSINSEALPWDDQEDEVIDIQLSPDEQLEADEKALAEAQALIESGAKKPKPTPLEPVVIILAGGTMNTFELIIEDPDNDIEVKAQFNVMGQLIREKE